MKKSNWYEFKKLYTASNPDDCLFHAYVADKDNYRIIIDENNIFKDIFLSIISGSYKMYPIIKKSYKEISINSGDAIQNLREYISLLSSDIKKNKFILQQCKEL